MRLSPGSSTLKNLPSRSTTQAFCCGTMRTPSKMNTTIIATRKVAMVAAALCVNAPAATVSSTAMMAFQNMETSRVGAELALLVLGICGRRGGHHQGVAFVALDVERGSRAGTFAGARHARIPGRAAVFHARDVRGLVGPALEHHGLAAVEEVGAARLPPVGVVPVVHREGARERHGAADHGLHPVSYTH